MGHVIGLRVVRLNGGYTAQSTLHDDAPSEKRLRLL
jgi:hypothetical protein